MSNYQYGYVEYISSRETIDTAEGDTGVVTTDQLVGITHSKTVAVVAAGTKVKSVSLALTIVKEASTVSNCFYTIVKVSKRITKSSSSFVASLKPSIHHLEVS